MQNPIQKFRQSSVFFEKQVFCIKNWKLWPAPTTIDFNIFCWTFAHVLYLPVSTKECGGFFILFRTWVICQNQNNLVSKHSQKLRLSITQDLSKIKKSHTPFCRHS